MAAAILGNLFRPRGRHERIRGEEEDDDGGATSVAVGTPRTTPPDDAPPVGAAGIEAVLTADGGGGSAATAPSVRTEAAVEDGDGTERAPAGGAPTGDANEGGDGVPADGVVFGAAASARSGSGPGASEQPDAAASASAAAPPRSQQERLRAYFTQRRLAELEEERELRRRRQSTCTLVVAFVLFRLWVEALAEGDVGLMLICLLGTSWTARWIRSRRDQEDEMDRAIASYVREAASADGGEGGRTITLGDAPALAGAAGLGQAEAADLRLMSFQAQLALAILESQRQMMENGGHGHPGGERDAGGVSEASRGRWTRFEYRVKEGDGTGGDGGLSGLSPQVAAGKLGGYGSVSSSDDDLRLEVMEEGGAGGDGLADKGGLGGHDDSPADDDDGSLGLPSCSICLGEYEEGERLVRLPCAHVYHEECVSAWASNHVRCPLCNYDLEAGDHETSSLESPAVQELN